MSAGSLLLTVLGEFVLPTGEAWTASLVESLALLGVEEKAARQALARSALKGWLEADRIGRRTRWHLTPQGERLLRDGTERIYTFGTSAPPWGGEWLILLTSVPEGRRDLRYRLRTRLRWAGFAPARPGVWLSPRVEREAEAATVVAELGIQQGSSIFVARLGAIGDARTLSTDAWDIERIEAKYESFLVRFGGLEPSGPQASFVALASLVHEWRRFPLADPGLPRELLPGDWKGQQAADLFRAAHHRWKGEAWTWWSSLGPEPARQAACGARGREPS